MVCEKCKPELDILLARIEALERRLLVYENAHTPPSRQYKPRSPPIETAKRGAPKGHKGATLVFSQAVTAHGRSQYPLFQQNYRPAVIELGKYPVVFENWGVDQRESTVVMIHQESGCDGIKEAWIPAQARVLTEQILRGLGERRTLCFSQNEQGRVSLVEKLDSDVAHHAVYTLSTGDACSLNEAVQHIQEQERKHELAYVQVQVATDTPLASRAYEVFTQKGYRMAGFLPSWLDGPVRDALVLENQVPVSFEKMTIIGSVKL